MSSVAPSSETPAALPLGDSAESSYPPTDSGHVPESVSLEGTSAPPSEGEGTTPPITPSSDPVEPEALASVLVERARGADRDVKDTATSRNDPAWATVGDDQPLSDDAIRAVAALLLESITEEEERAGAGAD